MNKRQAKKKRPRNAKDKFYRLRFCRQVARLRRELKRSGKSLHESDNGKQATQGNEG